MLQRHTHHSRTDHQRVHQRSADLQDRQATAPPARWLAATASALIVGGAAPALAEPEGLRPVIARHGWQIDLTGYVQVDAVAYAADSIDEVTPDGDLLNTERLLIRRGRLRTEARRDALSAALELDANTINGPAARILSATVGWQYKRVADALPLVALTAGLFKTPFGAEVPANERDKAFLEPPAFARALVPGSYDAGVMARGAYGVARWSIAIVNGAPVGDLQWHGHDPSGSHDIVGRIGAELEGPRKLRVEAGISALTGEGLHAGTPSTKDGLQWVDENQDGIVQTTELQVVPGATATPSENFDRNALGADLQVHWCICRIGNGTAFAEATLATNLDRGLIYADPVAASRDYRELGFAVGVVQDLGEHAQVGVRYDRYDGDRDVVKQLGVAIVGEHEVFSTLSVMATARWHDARVLVQYDHERNPFGRDDNGMAITRSADRLTLRAQVGF